MAKTRKGDTTANVYKILQANQQRVKSAGLPVSGTPTTPQQAVSGVNVNSVPGTVTSPYAANTAESIRRAKMLIWANKQNKAMDADLARQRAGYAFDNSRNTEAERRAGIGGTNQRIAAQNQAGFTREKGVLGAALGGGAPTQDIEEVYGGQHFNAVDPNRQGTLRGGNFSGGWGFGSSPYDRSVQMPPAPIMETGLNTAPGAPTVSGAPGAGLGGILSPLTGDIAREDVTPETVLPRRVGRNANLNEYPREQYPVTSDADLTLGELGLKKASKGIKKWWKGLTGRYSRIGG